MSTSKTKIDDAYHHGDLRRALLEAAISIVETEGHQALTIREAARRAGVSHNAPYRHFANLDALIAAVAAAGFDRLTETLQPIVRAEGMALNQRRLALGRGYLDFALAHPRLYQLMFSGIDPKAHPDLDRAADGAFRLLAFAIEMKGAPFTEAIAALAAAHGLATLVLIGFIGKDDPEIAQILTGSTANAPKD